LTKILELQEKEKVAKQESERVWTYEAFVSWARDEVCVSDPEKWLEEKLDLSDLSRPRSKVEVLNLAGKRTVKRIPPNLIGEYLDFDDTGVEEISDGIVCERLSLTDTDVKTIPSDSKCKCLTLAKTKVKEIPSGLICTKLWLVDCDLQKVSGNIQIQWLSVRKNKLSKDLIEQLERLKTEGKIRDLDLL